MQRQRVLPTLFKGNVEGTQDPAARSGSFGTLERVFVSFATSEQKHSRDACVVPLKLLPGKAFKGRGAPVERGRSSPVGTRSAFVQQLPLQCLPRELLRR